MSTRITLQHYVSATEPSGAALGDEWYNNTTGVLYKRLATASGVQWVNISGLVSSSAGSSSSSSGTISAASQAKITGIALVFAGG